VGSEMCIRDRDTGRLVEVEPQEEEDQEGIPF
jgi:hypothetical protein